MATSTSPATISMTAERSSVADLAEQFQKFHGAELTAIFDVDGAAVPVAVLPAGKTLQSVKRLLDEYRSHPERICGTATLATLTSLIDHVHRFKAPHSALFARRDRSAPSITAVYDYSDLGQPRYGVHRAIYACPLSDAWKAWNGVHAKWLDQAAFAEFLEDRITDVVLAEAGDTSLEQLADQIGGRFAGPAALMTLSRGLQVNVASVVKQAVSLATGEIAVQYEEQHRDGAGAPITTPNLFCIAIPVFDAGAPYRIPVRLRYRVVSGKITWAFHLYRAEAAFDDAFREACEQATAETGVPLFFGAPEA